MKIMFNTLIFYAFLIFTFSPTIGFSESSVTSPALQTLDSIIVELRKEIDSASKEVETAELALHKLQEASPAAPADKISDHVKTIDVAQKKLGVARQRVEALTNATIALRDQDPIHKTVGELKTQLDMFPADGNDQQKKQRASILWKIEELEKIGRPESVASLGGAGIWIFAIFIVGLIIVALVLIWKFADNHGKKGAIERIGVPESDAVARIRLATAMTSGPMFFIVFISVLTLGIAGLNAAFAPNGVKDTELFFDIAKWVLATVLPVVAAWVGGVMAYYFGKDNFNAGAENAEKLLKEIKLTPQQKLATLKAGESGKEIDKATVYKLKANAKLGDAPLDDIKQAFGTTFQRLPILDDKGYISACLHMSTLTKYLTDSGHSAVSGKTLNDLITSSTSWDPALSFDTVSLTDNLVRVQELIKARKECSDIFVTATGKKDSPALRWITNDDIMRAADS